MEEGFSLDVAVEDRVVHFESVNVFFTDAETCAFGVSFVDEEGTAIEAGFVSADDCFGGVADFELDFFVDLVADIVETFLDENDFVDIIQLRKDYKVFLQPDWV